MSHLAAVLMDLGQLTESEALRRHAFDLDQKNATHNAANSDLRADLANSLLAEGRIAEARELYPGKSMPESLGIVKWLQGQVDLSKGDPTLLVFWEEWCGFSQAQLPRLEELYERFADRGLRIVGMAHDEEGKVRACLQARNLRYPNTMIDRAAMRELGVTGFPSACLFYDNALIWQAHPDRLSKEMFNGLLSAQPAGS
jgi:thiol-disulfide isomerase/thioredoxin